jgi:hypothetical protein
MSKYVALSVNQNVDYEYFIPLTCWTWRKIGYEPILFYSSKVTPVLELVVTLSNTPVWFLAPVDGVRSSTIAQVSRLYAGCLSMLSDDDYILVADADMLALSDAWNPDLTKVTVYNYDLTGFTEIPMCYAGAPKKLWTEIMNLNGLKYNDAIRRDIENYPNAKSNDFYTYWGCDQQMLTKRLKEYGTGKIDFINRGQYPNGYAKGRVDRGSWTLNHEQLIDAHLEQQTWQNDTKVGRLMELLRHNWPKEDFTWMEKYTSEFRKLAV